MNTRGLIIVTLFFMLIVGTLLFFTIINMDEENFEVKMSLTSATTTQEKPISFQKSIQEDYVIYKTPTCRY